VENSQVSLKPASRKALVYGFALPGASSRISRSLLRVCRWERRRWGVPVDDERPLSISIPYWRKKRWEEELERRAELKRQAEKEAEEAEERRMKPRFISKAPWAQTSKLAHIPRSLPTGRRVPCNLDVHVLFTDASLTRRRGGQGVLRMEGRKRTAKKGKGSTRNGADQCATQRTTQS